MHWLARSWALLALWAASCSPPAGARLPASPAIAQRFAQTEALSQTAAPSQALDAWLELLADVSAHPDWPEAIDLTAACLDAIATRRLMPLDDLGAAGGPVAFIVPDGPAVVRARLDRIWQEASPAGAIRMLVARAGLHLAMYDGDAREAATWRHRAGCVRSAVVYGPITPFGLSTLSSGLDLSRPGTPLPSRMVVQGDGSGSPRTTVAADGCDLPLLEASSRPGLRVVVVDIDNDRPRGLVVSLTSRSAGVLSVGGVDVVTRPFEAGGRMVSRMGAVRVAAGRVRIVARVAVREDGDSVAMAVVGDDGLPVRLLAPAPGDRAAVGARLMDLQRSSTADAAARLLRASALLAMGDARGAERTLEDEAARPDADPLVLTVYGRALSTDSALPDDRRVERMRDAYERAAEAMPGAWEPVLARAWLEGQRRGHAEARLRAIAALRRADPPVHPMVSAFEAAMAGMSKARDVAGEAFSRTRQALGPCPVVAVLDDLVQDRGPAERARFRCSTAGLDRSALDCYAALTDLGDAATSIAELGRLRALRGSPAAFRALEASSALRQGDGETALRMYETLPPGARFFAPLSAIVSSRPLDVSRLILRDLPTAPHDVSAALDLVTAITSDAVPTWDARGAAVVDQDRRRPVMPDAALLVLDHDEIYEVHQGGVVYYVAHDVRRVSGTTDIEQSEQSTWPAVEGVDAHRVLRRRVHKRDGRVVEPSPGNNAEQRNADLSQLQPGDYVEQLVVGFVVAGPWGRWVIDTPDLMPERASVHRARVVVRRDAGVDLGFWAHPLLTAAPADPEAPATTRAWELRDQQARRVESSAPRMDRAVRITFGNASWEDLGGALREAVEAMKANHPAVARKAREAAGGEAGASMRVLQRVVSAVGVEVPVASGTALSDSGALMSSGPQRATARTVIESSHGSRTWLAHEMLRSLSVPVEVAVAEDEPFSSAVDFPAHPGRFTHPLLLVHLPATAGGDTWLDIDVPGPPLPPGYISPELRGRSALLANGRIVRLPEPGERDATDEVVQRLTLDEHGNARGTVVVRLRSREAQRVAEVFQSTVGEARRGLLRSVVLAWLPRADVTSIDLSSGQASWEVEIRATLVVPGFAQPEGRRFLLPGVLPLHRVGPEPHAATLSSTVATQAGRESALAVGDAIRYRLSRRIELPAGWCVVSAPGTNSVENPNLRASRSTRWQGQVIEESFDLALSTGTVPADQVQSFASDAQRTDDVFLSGIGVTR